MRLPFAAFLVLGLLSPVFGGDVDLPRNPSISPDGKKVVFSWRGDLWTVSAAGGRAARLTAHPSSDLRSAWSPDGKLIAFNSRRGGALNVFTMRPDGSQIRQVTHSDLGVVLGQFAHRGQTLTFHGRLEGDVYRGSRSYLVRRKGGPYHRVHDAFGSDAVISPDGLRLAFVRGSSRWTRRNYRGPDSRDVWIHDYATAGFSRLTTWKGNDGMPHWAGADRIVFASDRELDRVNLYAVDLRDASKTARRLTGFADRDVADLDVSADGSTAVFVAWDTLYVLDLAKKDATPRALKVSANEDERDRFVLQDVSRQVSEAALSPDGKTLAVIARGEVFVRAVGDHQPTRRVTRSHARERGVAWSKDGARLYFSSDRDGSESIYAAEVSLTRGEVREAYDKATAPPKAEPAKEAPASKPVEPTSKPATEGKGKAGKAGKGGKGGKSGTAEVTSGARWQDALRFQVVGVVVDPAQDDRDVSPSPDGKTLAFRRGNGMLCLFDLETQAVRPLVHGWDSSLHWSWSPGGRWLAYSQQDRDFNSEVFVVPADASSAPVNVSMHPDDDYDPVWSQDGKVLAFLSTRHHDGSDVWSVYLDRDLERLPRRDLERHFKDAGKATKKGGSDPKRLDLEGAWKRLRRVTNWPGDERGLLISPNGARIYVSEAVEGGRTLYSVGWDGKKKKKLAGEVNAQHLSADGGKMVVLSGGRPALLGLKGGKLEPVAVSAKLRVDVAQENSQKFLEAARVLGERFYHPTMKGRDWPVLTRRYHSLACRARTSDEFSDVAARFVGELNASHLGIYPPRERSALRQSNGRLGIDVRPSDAGFTVTRVLPQGPADRPGMRLRVGDTIVEVERAEFLPTHTLESRLKGRVGKDTLFTVRRQLAGQSQPSELLLLLRPSSSGEERQLRYQAWCADNARRVSEWSGGRLGYLHIRSMNGSSLIAFERDLYAAAYRKQGLIMDVRNNGGGWTADRVLASITARAHAYTVPRGSDPGYTHGYPRGRLFIQRYTAPLNLLCNQKSFSNAEIISHAFKTLKRGTLVGQTTYGGVISTGGTNLIDGTRVRLPFRGWYLPDGKDMENNGAVPDLIVKQTPIDECAGYDRQLRVAVDDMLKRIGQSK